MFDVLIIGAGICGTYIARELSRFKLRVALIDKANDVSNGTTKANSAIIHAGYDPEPGTLMAKLNARGNPMFDPICHDLDVPFQRIGSFVLAFNQDDLKIIRNLYNRGIQNSIINMDLIDKNQLRYLEPSIHPNAVGALYAKTAGIIGPWELAIALAENAMDNGVKLFLNNTVQAIHKEDSVFTVKTQNSTFHSKIVINCAGVHASRINNLIAPAAFKINQRRGEYYVLDKTVSDLIHHVIFQPPGSYGKGVLITPTVHGNVLVGPNSDFVTDDDALQTTDGGLDFVREMSKKSYQNIPFNKTINIFAGLRAEPDTGDFIIGESPDVKGFLNVAGIKSPGLSASPAIAEMVVEIVDRITSGLKPNPAFKATRKKVYHFSEMTDMEKSNLIDRDPRYARIVCRCENITEGEIVDAIHRNAGATTVDGVKRRVRPGTGRCQGGFCMPRVIEILARELKQDMSTILKDGPNSQIITGTTKTVDTIKHEETVVA